MAKIVDKFLIMDFESSGLDAKKNQALSGGFIVVDKNTMQPIEELYVEAVFDASKYTWTAGAQNVHGFDPFGFSKHMLPLHAAGEKLYRFIYKHFGGEPVILSGHNVDFDRQMAEQWLREAGMEIRFSHRIIDTNSIGMAVYNTNTSNELFEKVGVTRGVHNALEDAKACLKVLQASRGLTTPVKKVVIKER